MVMTCEMQKRLSGMHFAPYFALASLLISVPRKVGGNQFRHCSQTFAILLDYGYVESILLKTALVHDAVEDLPDFNHKLIIQADNEGVEVYKTVLEVSRRQGEDKSSFLKRILETGSRNARLVKIADRISNMTDIGFSTSLDFVRRYCNETEQFVLPMAEGLDHDMATELRDLVASRRAYLCKMDDAL
jgi:GTP pyrophosphokinase